MENSLAYLFNLEMANDFTIARGKPRCKDLQIGNLINIKKMLQSGANIGAKKSMGAFSNQNPEFEFEINIAKLYLQKGETQKATDVIESIRTILFKRFEGKKIFEKRIQDSKQTPENAGDFYKLPKDVVFMITKKV